MAPRISVRAMAKELGVTPSTVSRALAGKKGLSEETRQRVVAAAMRHGYLSKLLPDPAPVEVVVLIEKKTREDRGFWGKVTDGIEDGMSLYGNSMTLIETESATTGFDLPPIFQEVGRVAGVIAVHDVDLRAIQAIRRLGLPVVLVSHLGRYPGCDSVIIDSYNGTFIMATELLKMGHRKLAFVGHQNSLGFRLRYMGIMAALVEYGLADTPRRYAPDLRDMDWEDLPTVLLCASDRYAVGVVDILLRKGIRIPEDVSVVGFDDHPDKTANCPIALTTLRVDTEGLGLWAVRLLAQRLSNPEAPPVQLVSEVVPVWRESCAMPGP